MIVISPPNTVFRGYSSVSNTDESIKARTANIWQTICSFFCCFSKSYSYTYAFSQQGNPDCHMQMWANFHRLQQYRARDIGGRVVLQRQDFLSYRHWLSQTILDFTQWMKGIHQPKISHYMTEGVKSAPLYPHFYDVNRNNYFTSPRNFVERAERKTLSPYFMKEAIFSQTAYELPMFEKQGNYFCYDVTKREYVPVKNNGTLHSKEFELSPGQLKALPENFFELELSRSNNGKILAYDRSLTIEGKYVPRQLGTYKLLLLNFGLDSKNNPFDSQDAGLNEVELEVHRELQQYMKDVGSSWSPDVCKKENLIEYCLTELFKSDQELFNQVSSHVDFYFRSWSRYEVDLHQLFDQNGERLSSKNLARYLPGREQMLAYCLMKNIQYLWVSAISSIAFCHHLALPTFLRHIPFLVGPNQHRKAAYQPKDGLSFIDLWKIVRKKLQERYPDKLDWVTFSEHGMVISFDPDLIRRQNTRRISNVQLAEDLGIAGIDSLHGRDMDVFYRNQTN